MIQMSELYIVLLKISIFCWNNLNFYNVHLPVMFQTIIGSNSTPCFFFSSLFAFKSCNADAFFVSFLSSIFFLLSILLWLIDAVESTDAVCEDAFCLFFSFLLASRSFFSISNLCYTNYFSCKKYWDTCLSVSEDTQNRLHIYHSYKNSFKTHYWFLYWKWKFIFILTEFVSQL